MEYKNLILLLGVVIAGFGLILLWKGKVSNSISELSLFGVTMKLQNTALVLITIGIIVFLVPYLNASRGVANLHIAAYPFKVKANDLFWIVWNASNVDDLYLIDHNKKKEKVKVSGDKEFRLDQDGLYTLEGNKNGNTMSVDTRVVVLPSPTAVIKEFAFDPPQTEVGSPVILHWKTQNVDKAYLAEGGKPEVAVAANDYIKIKPESDLNYSLRIERNVIAHASLKVKKLPLGQLMGAAGPTILYFKGSKQSVRAGEPVELSWDVTNANEVRLSTLGEVPIKGSQIVYPKESTNYTLTALNDDGINEDIARIEMILPVAPTVQFSAMPNYGKPRERVTLKWDVQGADEVVIEPHIGKVNLQGSQEVILSESSVVYKLTAYAGTNKNEEEIVLNVFPDWLKESSKEKLMQQLLSLQ